MAGATIEFDSRQVLAALQGAIAVLRSPDALLRDMGEYLLLAHDARFASQTAPDGTPWQALSPRYLKRKPKNKDRILRLDGYLMNTLRYQLDGSSLLFGSDRPYAAIQHFGGEIQMAARSQQAYFRQAADGSVGQRFVKKKASNFAQWVSSGPYVIRIPARPFLGTSEADDQELVAIAEQHLQQGLDGGAA